MSQGFVSYRADDGTCVSANLIDEAIPRVSHGTECDMRSTKARRVCLCLYSFYSSRVLIVC
ncbi:hypothetical protein F4803DRAFT_507444 [Xylaria telfairii]|nr:hypothetical protein F4803DRAFT_507444 [Xylaria telfairii]